MIYYVLVVTMHLEFGEFVARTLDIPLGRDKYNLVILGLFSLTLVGFLLWFIKGLRKQPPEQKKVTLFYLISTLLLIIISINVIMVVNIELIHVLQYAVFAIVLFSIIGSYFDVLFWTTFAGALDELYQYVYLSPTGTDYYDLNDVVINLLGAALGLILLRSQGVKNFALEVKWSKSSWFVGTVGIASIICSLWFVGELTFYPNGKLVLFEFIRDYKPGFWREIPPKVLFHVIKPLEGLIILVLLFIFYKKLPLIHEK